MLLSFSLGASKPVAITSLNSQFFWPTPTGAMRGIYAVALAGDGDFNWPRKQKAA